MIDEKATYKKYGYCSYDLKSQSHKKIIAVCDICGRVRKLDKRDYRNLCQKCVMGTKEVRKKLRIIATGRILSVETRNKISKANKGQKRTKEFCENLSKKFTGHKVTAETRNKISNANNGQKRTTKVKKQISLATKGKNNGMYGRTHTKQSRSKMSLTRGGTGIPHEHSKYPAEFFEIREQIRKRDNFKCQMSGMTEKEHIKKHGKKLDVHHIDYDKQNCKEDNLITLTNKWNNKVNQNRKCWTKYFKEIVRRKK